MCVTLSLHGGFPFHLKCVLNFSLRFLNLLFKTVDAADIQCVMG